MRPLFRIRICIALVFALTTFGCASSSLPPPPPPPPPPPLPLPQAMTPEPSRGDVPRVIRRLLAEEKELVDHSRTLAAELPDPRGRARALKDVGDIADAIAKLEAPLDEQDSAGLDATVDELIREFTKIALLHEILRTATNRTTALVAE